MKMFTSGLGLQMAFKIILNFKLLKSPRRLGKVLLNTNNLKLAIFLSGFTGTFRVRFKKFRRLIQSFFLCKGLVMFVGNFMFITANE